MRCEHCLAFTLYKLASACGHTITHLPAHLHQNYARQALAATGNDISKALDWMSDNPMPQVLVYGLSTRGVIACVLTPVMTTNRMLQQQQHQHQRQHQRPRQGLV